MNVYVRFTFIVLATFLLGCLHSSQLSNSESSTDVISSTIENKTELQLSDDDKTQIIAEILKQENLQNAKKQKQNSENIIYVEGQFPVKQIPQIDGIQIKFIPSFAEAGKESEIVFYEFRDFRIKDSEVVIPVIWNKRDSSSGHQAIIEYTCQKISDKWKVDGKTVGLSVSESH